MRKLMNKKGFSLVELMIVVVIMGILIAVAIPLYGAVTKNANNKTCSNNIKSIKSNAATYASTYNEHVQAKDDLQSMYDDGKMPVCPINKANAYKVSIGDKGEAKVQCPNVGTDSHAPEGSDTVAAADELVQTRPAAPAEPAA